MSNFIGLLKLSAFLNSRVVELENDDGVKERGIFIPEEINGLYISPRHQVMTWFFANERVHDLGDGFTHYVKLKNTSKNIQRMKDLGYKVPLIATMRPSEFSDFNKPDEKRATKFNI